MTWYWIVLIVLGSMALGAYILLYWMFGGNGGYRK
jgi:hypothetical protein